MTETPETEPTEREHRLANTAVGHDDPDPEAPPCKCAECSRTADVLAGYRERLAQVCDAEARKYTRTRERVEADGGKANRIARLEASEASSEECAHLIRSYGAPA